MFIFKKTQFVNSVFILIVVASTSLSYANPIVVQKFDSVDYLRYCKFSPDNAKVLAAGIKKHDGLLFVYDLNQKAILTYAGHVKYGSGINCMSFSSDGRMVLSGGNSYTALLWDANTGETLHEFKFGDELVPFFVESVCITNDNKYAVIAVKGFIHIFDLSNFNIVSKFEKSNVYNITSYNDSNKLVIGSVFGTSVVNLQGMIHFENPTLPGYLSTDNKYLYSVMQYTIGKGHILKYDAKTGDLLRTSDSFDWNNTENQNYVFISTGDAFLVRKTNRIMEWNKHKKVVDVVNNEGVPVNLQSFSNDDQYVSAIEGNTLYIYATKDLLSLATSYNSY